MLMYMIVAYIYVAIWRVQDAIPILGKLQFPILVEILTIGLFLTDSSPLRRVKRIQSPLTTMLLLFIGIMLVGLPMSLWPGKGFTFITKDFIPYLLLMVMLATTIRDERDLEWFGFQHLVAASLFAVYALLFCPVQYDGKMSGMPFYDANDLALLMACSIPFGLYFIRPSIPIQKRVIAFLCTGILFYILTRAGSRGGFLGVIGLVLYIVIFYRSVPARIRVSAVTAGAAVMLILGSAQYWKMMQSLLHPENDYNMTEETGRKKIWKRGIGYMWSHPFLGVGIRAFPQAEGTLSEVARRYAAVGRGIKWSVAHNSFVEIGAECGVFALGLFLAMLLYSIKKSSRTRPKSRGDPLFTIDDEAFGQTLVAAFICFMICGFFVSAEYFAYLYVLFGFVLAQQSVLRHRSLLRSVQTSAAGSSARPITKPPQTQPPQWLPTGS
jgi:O-antigen ligase